MKVISKNSVLALCTLALARSAAYADSFTLADPDKGIFKSGTKVVDTVFTLEWLIKGGAGLFAITCFIGAGNLARQGNYGRAAGAVIGGIIASIGAYLVSISQK